MKCRNCGATIAANALICYKCGSATSEPRLTPPAARPSRSRAIIIGVVLVGLAAAAAVREVACGTLL